MRTIIVKIESADDVAVTAESIEHKWNFCPTELRTENKIKVTLINQEMDWISVADKLPPDVQKNVKVKMPGGRETSMYGSYLNHIIKNPDYLPENPRPTHWK